MPICAPSTFVVGIGGNIGSGKTTLAKIFQKFGAKIIDADKIGWSLLKQSTKEYRKIIHSFGKSILDRNQEINRKKLGEIVFANTKRLHLLNQIIHPALLTKIRQEIRKQKGIVILDAALLFNWGLEKKINASILVSATKRLKIERSRLAGMARKTAEVRLSKQLPEKIMAKRADFVIKNNGTPEDLWNKAEELWQLFNKCRRQ
jgi:dephospho-CoA kinase